MRVRIVLLVITLVTFFSTGYCLFEECEANKTVYIPSDVTNGFGSYSFWSNGFDLVCNSGVSTFSMEDGGRFIVDSSTVPATAHLFGYVNLVDRACNDPSAPQRWFLNVYFVQDIVTVRNEANGLVKPPANGFNAPYDQWTFFNITQGSFVSDPATCVNDGNCISYVLENRVPKLALQVGIGASVFSDSVGASIWVRLVRDTEIVDPADINIILTPLDCDPPSEPSDCPDVSVQIDSIVEVDNDANTLFPFEFIENSWCQKDDLSTEILYSLPNSWDDFDTLSTAHVLIERMFNNFTRMTFTLSNWYSNHFELSTTALEITLKFISVDEPNPAFFCNPMDNTLTFETGSDSKATRLTADLTGLAVPGITATCDELDFTATIRVERESFCTADPILCTNAEIQFSVDFTATGQTIVLEDTSSAETLHGLFL